MSADRPDIVLYCDDGHEEFVVQKFRWLVEQNIWIGTRKATAEISIYPGNSPNFPGLEGPIAERGHWPLRCSRCRRTSPAGGRMTTALDWLTAEKQRRISLKLLPVLLEKWPADTPGGQYVRYPR